MKERWFYSTEATHIGMREREREMSPAWCLAWFWWVSACGGYPFLFCWAHVHSVGMCNCYRLVYAIPWQSEWLCDCPNGVESLIRCAMLGICICFWLWPCICISGCVVVVCMMILWYVQLDLCQSMFVSRVPSVFSHYWCLSWLLNQFVVVKEAWEVWEGWTGSGSLDSLRKQYK